MNKKLPILCVANILALTVWSACGVAEQVLQTTQIQIKETRLENQKALPLPNKMEIFFDWESPIEEYAIPSSHPVTVVYYHLGYRYSFGPKINDELAKLTPEQAKTAVKNALQNKTPLFGVDVVAANKKSFEGSALLTKYNLSKVPAIVFDGGASLVYGVTDIGKALQLYGVWKQKKEASTAKPGTP